MSIAMAVGDVAEVRMNTTDGQSQIFNILHYTLHSISSTDPGPPPVALDADDFLPALAGEVYSELAGDWASCTPESWKYLGNTAQSVWPDPRSRPYNHFPAVPNEGTIVSHSLPAQDSATLLKKSVFGQRWGLGRFFFSGIPESMQDTGILSDPYIILLQAFCNELQEGISVTVGAVTGIWLPVLFGPGDTPDTRRITAITEVDVSDNVIKTQRRRRPGKGI